MFPAASGVPQLSGIVSPTIWSPKLLIKFYEEALVAHISNTEYEGEIKDQGDKVNIRTTPDIVITPHVKGQALVYQDPEPQLVSLEIDRGAAWAFRTNVVDLHQTNYDYVEDWTSDASKQQKIYIDTQVFATIYPDADSTNKGNSAGRRSGAYSFGQTGAPVDLDGTNIIQYIVDMGSALDENNVPDQGRWVVLPAWACGMIKKSELRDANLTGDPRSILRTGLIGMVDRFEIYMSNLLNTVQDGASQVTNAMFGHTSALTFATQFLLSEGPLIHPHFFGQFFRGLQVYGYKVIKPPALGHFYIRRAGT